MKKSERAIVIALLLIVFVVLGATYFIWKNGEADKKAAAPKAPVTPVTVVPKATTTTLPPVTVTTANTTCVGRSHTLDGESNKTFQERQPALQKWITDCGNQYPAKTAEYQSWMSDNNPAVKSSGTELVRTW